MNERAPERGWVRKTFDKVGVGVSAVTLPLSLYTAGTSVAAGNMLRAAVAGIWAFLDFTQLREHGRPPEKQSFYNPERVYDRVFGWFKPASTRTVRAMA